MGIILYFSSSQQHIYHYFKNTRTMKTFVAVCVLFCLLGSTFGRPAADDSDLANAEEHSSLQLVETQKFKRAAEDFDLADSIEYPEEQMIEGHEISKRAADAEEYPTMHLIEAQKSEEYEMKSKRAAEDFDLSDSTEYQDEHMIEAHQKQSAKAEEYPEGEGPDHF